jgi:N-acetylglucosaminyl-diphospho-decaprenol L-rhamnosyltransferase
MQCLRIDVVVPIHGHRAIAERCLRALAQQTLAHRTIIVENAHRGLAAACNAGIAQGSGDVVVLLEDDVIAPPAFLERLTAPLHDDPRVGSVASVLRRPESQLIDSAGLTADATLTGFPRLRGRPERKASAKRPVLLGPAGAAGAYRRVALRAVGCMDEQLPYAHEDLDLALRLRAAGWSTVLAPDARAEHVRSGGAP